MGGPSYQTPYPVSDQKGGQVIWDWNKHDWLPYTAPKPGANGGPPAPGAPGADREAADRTPSKDDTSTDGGYGQGDRAPDAMGPGMPQLKRGTTRRRTTVSSSSPGESLLSMRGDF